VWVFVPKIGLVEVKPRFGSNMRKLRRSCMSRVQHTCM